MEKVPGKAAENPMSKQNLSEKSNDIAVLLQDVKEQKSGAFEQLLEIYRPLLDASVAKFCEMGVDAEDLRQEALVAFYAAVLHYDRERGNAATFGRFAKVCVHNGIVSALRSLDVSKDVLSLDEKIDPVGETAEGPADALIASEDYAVLSAKVRESLSDYENRIWWLYLSGRTAKEIAGICKKNEKSVQNAICRIRRKLRLVLPNP